MLGIKKTGHFEGHLQGIYCLRLLSEGGFLSAGADGLVVEWQPKQGIDGTLAVKIPEPVWSLAVDSDMILAGTRSGVLYVADRLNVKETKALKAHAGGVFAIEKTQNGWISGGEDGRLLVWNNALEVEKVVDASNKSCRTIAIHEQTGRIAVGFSDCCIRIYDANLELLQTLHGHTNSVFSVCFSEDGRRLYSGGRDAVLRVWDIPFEKHFVVNAHWYHLNSIAVCGKYLLTASMDKTVKIWQADNMELKKVVDAAKTDAHKAGVNKVLWINANEFISCSDDRSIQMFQIED